MVKNLPANAGDLVSIPGLGRSPGGGHGNSLQYSCPEKSHRQRGLALYSPWGRQELDATERLSTDIQIRLTFCGEKSRISLSNWNSYVNLYPCNNHLTSEFL